MNDLFINSLKGMHDYFYRDMYIYNYVQNNFRKILLNYSFSEVKFPILENSFLYKKCINFDYNISSKEMYSFLDRNNINISLRPEGTIGCLKCYIKNKLFLYNILNKLWYIGPMFRRENPQKGRFRQFYQIGLECFGSNDYTLDIELLLVIKRLFLKLNIYDFLTLEINTIGSFIDRKNYINFINKNFSYLLNKIKVNKNNNINLIKLIDSKDKYILDILNYIPSITEFVNKNSLFNFKNICNNLDILGIKYKWNKNLVRGIDYYNDFVFEWKDNLDKKNTICSGGRYNELSKCISNISIPAVGCAFGLDRLINFLKSNNIKVKYNKIDIYIISSFNEKSRLLGLFITEKILNYYFNKFNIYNDNILYNNLSKLILKVIKLNVRFLIIIGEKELSENYLTFKDLYLNKKQHFNKNNIIDVINYFINFN